MQYLQADLLLPKNAVLLCSVPVFQSAHHLVCWLRVFLFSNTIHIFFRLYSLSLQLFYPDERIT